MAGAVSVSGGWFRRYLGVVASGLVAALVVTGLPPQRAWAEDPPVDDPAPEVSVPVARQAGQYRELMSQEDLHDESE